MSRNNSEKDEIMLATIQRTMDGLPPIPDNLSPFDKIMFLLKDTKEQEQISKKYFSSQKDLL